MIVMSPLNGVQRLPITNTMARAQGRADVYALQAMAEGARIQIAPRGMGAIAGVPTWAWAAGGGLVAGLVVGALVYKKKRR